MQTDSNLLFTGGTTGAAQAIAGATILSTGKLDLATGLMNTGATYATSGVSGGAFNLFPTTSLVFGEDLGAGAQRLRMLAVLAAPFTGGTSLNIQIVGLVDAGTGYPVSFPAAGNAAWLVFAETGPIPIANLAAAAFNPNRSIITLPDWPDREIATAMPRFIALQYVPAGTFTGNSAISSAGVFLQKPDFYAGQYPGGFQVAP